MKFENTCVIAASQQKLWEFLIDIPRVAQCLPGVQDVVKQEDGTYTGVQHVKVGIIKLKLGGKISIDMLDQENFTAAMTVQANDHRISGLIQGKLTSKLESKSENETVMTVVTDINLLGKIGEFGGPIIKKKSDQMMGEFAKNVAANVESKPEPK